MRRPAPEDDRVHEHLVLVDESSPDERGRQLGAGHLEVAVELPPQRASSSPGSPRTSRLFQSTDVSVDEKTILGMLRQSRRNSSIASVAAVGVGRRPCAHISSYSRRP